MSNSYAERMLSEGHELSGNLSRLNEFIGTVAWSKLGTTDRNLLIEQRNHMTAYLGVIQQRVVRLDVSVIREIQNRNRT